MFQTWNHRFGHYLLLLGVGWFMFFNNLGGPSLWDVDEGRNATAALEMLESGNWVIPTFNGNLRDHKPALLYWLQGFAYQWFGINEFAARLPSALAALVSVLLIYELGRSMFGAFTGLFSGLIAGTSILLSAAGRFANPDALLTFCTVLTFLLFWWGFSKKGIYPWFCCGAATGLAMLAKGPVGLVLPLSAIVLFLVWVRKTHLLWTWRILLGVVSFSLVALPWYALVCVETKGEFLRGFFLRHNVQRFLSPMEYHSGGPWYYVVVLFVGLAPWSIFLGLALWYGAWPLFRSPWPRFRRWWINGIKGENAAGDAASAVSSSVEDTTRVAVYLEYRFLWCWLAVYFVFFTFAATKLPNYVIPLTAPLAILIARYLDRWRSGRLRPPAWSLRLSFLAFALIGVLTIAGFSFAGGVFDVPALSGYIIPGLKVWAVSGLIPLVGALLAWHYWRRQRHQTALLTLALSSILFLAPLVAGVTEVFDQSKAPRPLVAQSGSLNRSEEMRIGNFGVPHLASLHFYCQRAVHYCYDESKALELLQYQVPVHLFLAASQWERIRDKTDERCGVLARHNDLYSGGEIVVIGNSPALDAKR